MPVSLHDVIESYNDGRCPRAISMKRGRRAVALVTATAFVAVVLPVAPAAAQTRAEFSASADAICRAQVERQKKSLRRQVRRVRPHREHGRGIAGFLRLDGLYDLSQAKTIDNSARRIATLPPAPGDELIVAQWLDSFHWDAVNARDAGRMALRKRVHFGRYFKLIQQAGNHAQATDLLVDGFGMQFCATNTHYSPVVSAERLP